MLNNLIEIQYCYDYLVNQISMGLLIYSHVPTALIALLFGGYIMLKNKRLNGITLFMVCFFFAMWSFIDLASWFTFLGSGMMMFTWSLIDLFGLLIFFFTYYFFYTFLTDEDLPIWHKIVGLGLIAPTAVWTFLGLTLTTYDANLCEALEDPYFTIYPFYVKTAFVVAILVLAIRLYKRTRETLLRKKIITVTTGVLLFLGFFLSSALGVNYLVNDTAIEFAYNYSIYGLFGMPILIAYLSFLIVRYHAFNLKIFSAQALVTSLIALIASQFAFVTTTATQILVGVTLLITSIIGAMLVRNIRKEIKMREQIEGLVIDLRKANERLKVLDKMKSEFVSIASHQLRSPLTSIRGYASMLAEGSYGKLAPKAQEIIQNIADSSMFMAQSVEDYLNVSRIEAGNMKYEMSDFNLKDIAEKIVDEMRSVAMKKGLVLLFRSDCMSGCVTHADIGKTRQVIMNLLDNSMKYTPKGTITVIAHDDAKKKKMYVTISDTGVGMSKETQEEVFDKFVRAKNANNINVTGTGLGLFVAKKMVEEMGGRVWAESEGEGKGSTFHIELPLVS